jgi:hypothetical protein
MQRQTVGPIILQESVVHLPLVTTKWWTDAELGTGKESNGQLETVEATEALPRLFRYSP